jgi:hypothetical protein
MRWRFNSIDRDKLYSNFNSIRVRSFILNGAPNPRYSATLHDAAPGGSAMWLDNPLIAQAASAEFVTWRGHGN